MSHAPSLEAPPIDPPLVALVRMAVREDIGHPTWGTPPGDKTVELAIPTELGGSATIVARKPGVVAGIFLLETILREYGNGADAPKLTLHVVDGQRIAPDQQLATLGGRVGTILSAERVVLNFLGRLSGIATLTRRYVDRVEEAVPAGTTPPVICDTRKTAPGFRALDKFAVRCGGGVNHRMGLYDGVMLKDNHLAALRTRLGKEVTLAQLVADVRRRLDPGITLWLEVDTLEQLRAALPVRAAAAGGDLGARGADIILLDNFTPEQMREAVAIRNAATASAADRPKVLLEASGGITLENLATVAVTGVERISIGALTHSAPALDLSFEFDEVTASHSDSLR